MPGRRRLIASLPLLPLLRGRAFAAAATPGRIRIGVPTAGLGGRPYSMGSYVSVMHAAGLLQKEFAGDDTEIVWKFFVGAGPAVNEALAEGGLDFAWQGDLPAIVARSRGLATRQLMMAGNRAPILLAANRQSGVTSLAALKGRTVANFQGTNIQLAVDRILASAGLTEQDVRIIDLDPVTAMEAVAQGQIDATFAQFALLPRLAARLNTIFVSGPRTPRLTTQASFLVTERFAAAYPAAVDRVVKTGVAAAWWSSQPGNRAALFALFGKTGFPASYIQAAFGQLDLKTWTSPLWDGFATAQLARSAADSLKFGLIRNPVSLPDWIDPGPLDRALAAADLTQYWTRYGPDGISRAA